MVDGPAESHAAQYVGVGCLTAVAGLFSGGMIAVLVSKVVAFFRRAPSCEGIPTCDWHIYFLVGATVGAVTLPWLTIRRLRQGHAQAPPSERG